MQTEKTSIYEDAITLLERAQKEIIDPERLSTLNLQLTGVVRTLNEDRIEEITGRKME